MFYQVRGTLPTYRADNKQRMALAVVAFARAKPREIPPLIVVTASHAGVCLRKLAASGSAIFAEAHGVWLHVWHVVHNQAWFRIGCFWVTNGRAEAVGLCGPDL
ncbi:MAG: hypothetical protein ACJ8AW_45815, partial [Rhodopila sp.]